MAFRSTYFSIILNGVQYNKAQIVERRWVADLSFSNPKETDWIDRLQAFLLDWISEEETIKVQTSGSTGTPKQIMLSKERMLNSAFMTGKYFDFKSGQKALLCLPCDYIAGKMMVVRALAWGLDLQLVPPSGNPMETINEAIDFAAMVPMQVQNVLEKTPKKFQLIRQLIIGGGKVNDALLRQLQNIPTACFATYGMTETITHVAIKVLNGPKKTNHFEALNLIEFSLDNRNCLVIDAPKLNPEKVVTNDIVALRSPQVFEWLGRFDNVINTGGVKVFPERIEEKIGSLLSKRFFITSLPDKKLENKVVLIVEDSPWKTEKVNALKAGLKPILSKFEYPKEIHFLATFKETPTKKIQRNRTKKNLEKFNL
ncbi:MAG: AMP-binding protein [Bacteroidota bacterium]